MSQEFSPSLSPPPCCWPRSARPIAAPSYGAGGHPDPGAGARRARGTRVDRRSRCSPADASGACRASSSTSTGVENAVSGYAGGKADTAQYRVVGSGRTGHAESVQVTFDPQQISYGKLLQIYFSVAHDPTELNRQGPDTGTQYRSTIFPQNDEQARIAKAYIAQLDQAQVFDAPIVTTIEPGRTFYPAEDYHQDYLTLNPTAALHRLQRPAEDREPQAALPGASTATTRCWSRRRAAPTEPRRLRSPAGSPPPRRRARFSTGAEPSRSAMVRATRSTR